MIYTDGIHLVADTIQELHVFALGMNLGRSYFHGVMKKHPHYDLTTEAKRLRALTKGAHSCTPREIIIICRANY